VLWSAHRGALSIRAEYMRSGFGDGQSWRFEIDEMSFLDSVYKPGNSYMLGYQCSQVKQPPNKRLTSQVFIYQQLQRPVTACSNVLESALHGNKSYNSYSQPARLDLLPHCLLGIVTTFTQHSYGVLTATRSTFHTRMM